MNFQDWVKSVPGEITGDALWRVEAYRLALFAAELGWYDVTNIAERSSPLITDHGSRLTFSANYRESHHRSQ